MEIVKIAAVCLTAAVAAKVIQPTNRDLAALLSISAVIFCAFLTVDGLSGIFSGANGLLSDTGVGGSYISAAFRALGICYVCELSSSSCRDCGETALAGIIDISGRAATAILMLPFLKEFLTVIRTVLGR